MADENTERPVDVKDLKKSFGEQKVLDGLSFQVRRGETLAVLGKSGTGKSVLLKILIGLQPPDSGSVRMEGQEIVKLDSKQLSEVRKKVGFLFQQAALYDSLTVAQNVEFPLIRHTDQSPSDRHARVPHLLPTFAVH